MAQWVKNLPIMQKTQETQFRSLSQEDLLEDEMATHSSFLTWKIPWTEEPGRLQSMGSQGVRHDRAHGTIYIQIYRHNCTSFFLASFKNMTFRKFKITLENKSSCIWSKIIFEKASKVIQWGKDVSSTNGAGKTGYPQ